MVFLQNCTWSRVEWRQICSVVQLEWRFGQLPEGEIGAQITCWLPQDVTIVLNYSCLVNMYKHVNFLVFILYSRTKCSSLVNIIYFFLGMSCRIIAHSTYHKPVASDFICMSNICLSCGNTQMYASKSLQFVIGPSFRHR